MVGEYDGYCGFVKCVFDGVVVVVKVIIESQVLVGILFGEVWYVVFGWNFDFEVVYVKVVKVVEEVGWDKVFLKNE